METGLVRSFDTWISRVVDLLSADPLRRQSKVKVPAPPPPPPVEARPTAPKKAAKPPAKPEVKKPAAKKIAVKKIAAKKTAVRKPAARKTAAKKAAVKKPAARKTAAKKIAAKKAKAPASRKRAVGGALEEKVLAALAALGGDAAMKDLVGETGEARSALTASLGKLASAGRIRRVGAGLRTRYETIED